MKIEIIARKVNKCSVFKEGDKFVIEGAEVNMAESDKICVYALSSFLPVLTAISKGVKFEDFGIGSGDTGKLRCIETDGGVEFEIKIIKTTI